MKMEILLESASNKLLGSQVAYLLLYVDDIILTVSSPTLLQHLTDSLQRDFDMTDLGVLNYFLGISVFRHSTGLFLSQRKYALPLLDRDHMVNCNPSRTPVDTESKLGPDGVPVQDPTLYRIQQICLYMHDPREPHLAALKRILQYVQAINGGQRRSTTAGPPVNHRRTTGQRRLTASQRSGQMVATAATWHATSANWVLVAYVAATSAADMAEGIITFQHRFELGTS
ncbi:ribonuclease H-like domain-containing protein [Tanacetum coccineum]